MPLAWQDRAPGCQYPFGMALACAAPCYALRVSLDQLSYFVAVAEERNIGRAARRLHISQPPLSRQIQNLETELGTPLFRRTTTGVELLPAGDRLLPHARGVLEAVAGLVAVASGSGGSPPGGAPPVSTGAPNAP
jgi:DNA-binding transcriptional LysR family regulator